jgi:murein L,D-transpeptidase YcbB/YkuD
MQKGQNMKNIHEILKGYDIEIPADKKAEFDKAVLDNYKTVAEAEKLRTARDNYKSQLDDATQKLEGFKGVNVEELQGKITALTDDLASQKAAFDKQLADRDFDDMLNTAITGSKAKNVKAVRALLDLEAIKASKNQSADIEAALKKVKEENDYLFTSEEPIDNGQFVGRSGSGSGGSSDDALRAIMGLSPETK